MDEGDGTFPHPPDEGTMREDEGGGGGPPPPPSWGARGCARTVRRAKGIWAAVARGRQPWAAISTPSSPPQDGVQCRFRKAKPKGGGGDGAGGKTAHWPRRGVSDAAAPHASAWWSGVGAPPAEVSARARPTTYRPPPFHPRALLGSRRVPVARGDSRLDSAQPPVVTAYKYYLCKRDSAESAPIHLSKS